MWARAKPIVEAGLQRLKIDLQRRVRSSVAGGVGFEASLYELSVKGYLAIFLNQINLDDFLKRVDDAAASAILGAITGTTRHHRWFEYTCS